MTNKLIGVLVFAGLALAGNPLHEQVLHTQVRVRAEKAGGSGTVIYSKQTGGYYSTYIITCHHVIEEALKIQTKWDSFLQRDRKHELRAPVLVEFFSWAAVPHGRLPLTSGASADIVAYDAKHDMALLHLRLAQPPVTAKLLAPERVEKIVIGTPTVAVGCALLHDPILTMGIVTHQGDQIDYADYWMSNAQIIFGNSGGGMFAHMEDGYHFIGIPSRIAVTGWAGAVTHMGYFSPITRVYQFFAEQMFDFLTPGSKRTEADCEAARKARQDAEKKRVQMMVVETGAPEEKSPGQ